MKRTVKRAAKWLSIALAVLLVAGIAAPYLSGNRFAPRIRAALESALGRKVELGAIHFSLFAGPGFSVDNVVIHENPAIGIEPIAYVGSWKLFRGSPQFSAAGWNSHPSGWTTPASTWPRRAALPNRADGTSRPC